MHPEIQRTRLRRAQAVCAAVALLLIAGMLSMLPSTSSARAADPLISQGKPATASSFEDPTYYPASYAVDGSTTTRWSSAASDPQWLEVDLGATYNVSQVVLNWEAAAGKAFQIQVSTNNTTWTSIYTTTTGTGGVQTLAVSGSGRYVRMYGTARTTGYGYSLWEFQVYGATASPPTTTPPITTTPPTTTAPTTTSPAGTCGTTNVALNKTATASSFEDPTYYPAAYAVDGNATTRWSSASSDPQWLDVDLGSAQSICKVGLTWEAAYGKSFQIQVSNDNTTWTSIYSTTTGTGGSQALTVSGTGRYIRMYGTARGTGYGYSLYEFTVNALGTTPPTSTAPPTTTAAPITTAAPTTTPPAGGGPDQGITWNPVWKDDFNGAAGSAPSATDWITRTGTSLPGGPANFGTGEVETMSSAPANLSEDGSGHLNITAIRDASGNWTSGQIETQRTDFNAPAGGRLKIAVIAKQPNVSTANGLGYWPGVRLTGASYRTDIADWPTMGELDLLNDVNGRSEDSASLACGPPAAGGPCNEYTGKTSGLATCTGCQTAYHTYSVVIDRTTSDEQIRWYVDNTQIHQLNESSVGAAAWQAAVDHGFFVKIDLAMGGSEPNAVCGCTSPSAATTSGGQLSIDQFAVSQTTGTAPATFTDPAVPAQNPSVVKVTGTQGNWQLMVNGAPWTIKGMTYGPPADSSAGYLNELKTMGVNTIRTWGTDATSKPLLDAAAARGQKVIAGFWLNQGADYVNDTAYKTSTLNTIVQWVNTYKNNPGVLMWDVGNEVLLTTQDHYTGAAIEQERDAYAAYVNQIADAIHAADPNHPVTSTDAWTGAWPYYKAYAPDLDLYALNSYGAVCDAKATWAAGGYTKPYILTEGGPAGEWEVPNDVNGEPTEPTEVQKAQGYTTSWGCITNQPGITFGGTEFNYGIEDDFGGVWLNVDPDGLHTLAASAVEQMYTGHPATNVAPTISNLVVTPKSTVAAGGTFTVSANVTDPENDGIRYNVMLNSKYVDGATALTYANFTQSGNTFTVQAPRTTGVFKVYLYAYDGHGNVGIETQSFKVVPPAVAGTNIALNQPTTASSFQATGTTGALPASFATDGNITTRWASAWADPQWLQVDLGSVKSFTHVELNWESAYATAYQLQTSTDGTNWTTVYSTTTGQGGFEELPVGGSGRYVRVNMTARATTYGDSLWEFGIYTG